MTVTAERIAARGTERDLFAAERAAAEFLTALGIDMTSPAWRRHRGGWPGRTRNC